MTIYFKLKWGDFKRYFTKSHTPEEMSSFKFYYEELDKILLFFKIKDTLFVSEHLKESDEDVRNFKLEFLADVKELLENPIKEDKWVISHG